MCQNWPIKWARFARESNEKLPDTGIMIALSLPLMRIPAARLPTVNRRLVRHCPPNPLYPHACMPTRKPFLNRPVLSSLCPPPPSFPPSLPPCFFPCVRKTKWTNERSRTKQQFTRQRHGRPLRSTRHRSREPTCAT